MKIVCMISSLRLGGAERQLLGLAAALQREGHEVEVLTYRRADFYAAEPARLGLRHTMMEKKGGLLPWARRTVAYLRESSCEVLIAFLPGACLKACLVHHLSPTFRLVVSERNFSIRLRLTDRFRLWCFRREADRVVCNNFSQEALIRRRFPAMGDRLDVIPNFVDVERFVPRERAPLRMESDALDGTVVRIVVTARLAPRKNALGLIRAAALLHGKGYDFVIDWYGLESRDSYYRRCMRLLGRYGLAGLFRFHPAVVGVERLYADADWFCLPSFYEGTSNSLAEALSCGKPVVCSAVSDNPRYVREDVNGFLFDPRRPASIADALEKSVALDEGRRKAFGAASREVAEQNLSPQRFARAYGSMLEKL